MHDALVVGMGPAGASAAAEFARAGLSVLGLEWKAMPRYKVCGGALSARMDKILEPDYHDVVEETIHRVRFQFAGLDQLQADAEVAPRNPPIALQPRPNPLDRARGDD